MMQPPEAIELSLVGGLRIAGIRQRPDTAPATTGLLCLHGWLDNANSFVPMLPLLQQTGLDTVTVDLPGHGYSGHLQDNYGYPQLVLWTQRIIDALGWHDCILMGHSLGGGIALAFAAAAPESTRAVISIDAAGPLSEADALWPERLKAALDDRLHPERFRSRRFNNPEEAVASRLKASRMQQHSARVLIERQLQWRDEGFYWRFDPALRYASWQYQTEAQVQALLATIACPTLTIVASEGYIARREETAARLAGLARGQRIDLDGYHHLHMDSPEPVAAAVRDFLETAGRRHD